MGPRPHRRGEGQSCATYGGESVLEEIFRPQLIWRKPFTHWSCTHVRTSILGMAYGNSNNVGSWPVPVNYERQGQPLRGCCCSVA